MIWRILILFAVLLASVYLGVFLHHESGYVLIMINHWSIEASFWVASFSILFLALCLHFLLLLLKNIASVPQAWHQWLNNLKLTRAKAKTKKGLIEFSEGQWQTAKKHLISAAPNTDLPLVNYLTAARAAEELGDPKLRDEYLLLAQNVAPDATIAIELTQAQLQLSHGQWEEASHTLRALEIIAPDHPLVLKLLMQLYEGTNNWAEMIKILPKLKSSKFLKALDWQYLYHKAYYHYLIEKTKTENEGKINSIYEQFPKEIKQDAKIVDLYAQYLLQHGLDKEAEKILHDRLQHEANETLLYLYAKIDPSITRPKVLENLLKKNSNSAALNYCLGQIMLSKAVWGAAKTYLEKSIQLDPTPQAYYALGQLLNELDDPHSAHEAYRKGLLLII